MTDNEPIELLDDNLNARVLDLSSRSGAVLSAHHRTRRLVPDLPRADASPLRIALLGPSSAGKSMLIAALLRLPSTEVDELTDAAPKTNEPVLYPWNGATLVDLPGTLSGNDAHSDAARRGVRSADALLLVTTSELPGEAETAAVQQALGTDGFGDRCVVVVNKMNAENSDPEIILDEIRKRLGPFADRVPIVRTDAKDFVDAINDAGLTDKQRELLVTGSGIDALAEALQHIVEPGIDQVRPRAQVFELVRVLDDAEQTWVFDGDDLAAADAAAKVENAIAQAEARVLKALEIESDAVASAIRAAGSRIAISISEKDGKPADAVVRDADHKRASAVADFEADVSSSMRAAFESLAADFGDSVPEPGQWTFELDAAAETVDVSPDEESPLERNMVEAAKAAVKDGAGRLREALGKVAINTEKGGLADKVAVRLHNTRLGHKLLGGEKVGVEAGKFKPWGRGKAADKVAGAAGKLQWAALVIGPALDLKGLADDHFKRAKVDKYREKISEQFDEDARRTRDAAVDAGTQWLSGWLAQVEQSLSGLTERGAELIAERETALDAIRNLRSEADELVLLARPAED